MKRREFITLLGGAGVAWPLAARAQQGERMRRIGVLLPATADDPQRQAWFGAFLQALARSDWIIGRNVQIDTRWATADADAVRRHAAELAALAPDVILASGASTVGPLLQATRTVPIVFAAVADPVGAGFVSSLARPGGNATGFMAFEYSISGKWLELLKQIAPSVTRVAVLRDPSITSGIGQFGVIQAMAPLLTVEVSHVNVRDATEIEGAIMSFARFSNGGLIMVGPPSSVQRHSDLIVALAARHTDKLGALCKETGASAYTCDATSLDDVTRLFAAVERDCGAPDVIVYNASARLPGAFVDLIPVDVEKAIAISAFGGFLVAQQAARRMLPNRHGAVLLTGASASVKGYPQSAAFAMGKFALRGLAQSMARELSPQGIHVAHFVIDGGIRSARRVEPVDKPDSMLDPDAIAANYWNVL